MRCAACKNTADKAALSLCGECFSVAYCNSQCQTAHWNAGHFDQCAKIDAPVFFGLMRLEPAPVVIWHIIASAGVANPVDLVADLLDIMTETDPGTEIRGNELALMHRYRKRFLRWLFDLGQETEKELPDGQRITVIESDGPKPPSFNKLFPTYAKRKWLRRAILLAACQRPKIRNFESPVVLVEQLFELLGVPPMFILRQCFVAAAEAGHLDLIQLLTTKYNLVLTDGNKNEALLAAAMGGSMDVMQYLLDQYFPGYIPYHMLDPLKNETKHVEIVKLLIQIGKRVNYTKQSRRNAFINAAYKGHLETVKFFLEDDSVATDQKTLDSVFDAAVSGRHMEITKLLLKKGADIINQGETLVRITAVNGHLEMIKFLLENGADPIGKGFWKNQAIDAAAVFRHADVVKLLFQYGASLSEHKGNDAIVRFAEHGNLEMVKFLMEKGFNPRMDNDSALQNAAKQGHLQVVKFLLEQGADIEVCDDDVIQTVIDNGHVEMLKFLLENGIKMPFGAGFSIAALARSNHLEMIKFLLEKGAVDFFSVFTDKAMESAASQGHLEIVKLLLKTSDLYGFAIRGAVRGKQYETILYLLNSEFRKDTPIEALNEISENYPDLKNVADALLTEIRRPRDSEEALEPAAKSVKQKIFLF